MTQERSTCGRREHDPRKSHWSTDASCTASLRKSTGVASIPRPRCLGPRVNSQIRFIRFTRAASRAAFQNWTLRLIWPVSHWMDAPPTLDLHTDISADDSFLTNCTKMSPPHLNPVSRHVVRGNFSSPQEVNCE